VGERWSVIATAAPRSTGRSPSTVRSISTAPAEPPITITSRAGLAISALHALGRGAGVSRDDSPHIAARLCRVLALTLMNGGQVWRAVGPDASCQLLEQEGCSETRAQTASGDSGVRRNDILNPISLSGPTCHARKIGTSGHFAKGDLHRSRASHGPLLQPEEREREPRRIPDFGWGDGSGPEAQPKNA
jgi:hypothetical protein